MQGSQAVAASAETAEQKLAAAHKALRATRGIQFDFQAFEPPKPPPWLDGLEAFFRAVGPVLKYVFWIGVAVGAALILYLILREIVPETWFRKARPAQAPADWRPDADKAHALLEDADSLAARGEFEAAIHILLFRSIDDLARRRPGAVRPALTSRDIAGLEVLPPSPRAAFARLAQAVERSFFGGRPAGADEFAAARQDYEAFAFAEGWR